MMKQGLLVPRSLFPCDGVPESDTVSLDVVREPVSELSGDASVSADMCALPLLRSDTRSGFRYVNRRSRGAGYDVRLARDGQRHYIGKFATAEEAAVSVAVWLHRRAETPVYAKPISMTAAEAIDVAAVSGLALVRSKNATGFRHVHYEKRNNRFQAKPILNGKARSVGYFKTAEEAALRVAQTPGYYTVTNEEEEEKCE